MKMNEIGIRKATSVSEGRKRAIMGVFGAYRAVGVCGAHGAAASPEAATAFEFSVPDISMAKLIHLFPYRCCAIYIAPAGVFHEPHCVNL
jgi:hypothetical protein